MGTYETLSAIPFARKSYVAKFLLVAFVGIHVPIIGIAGYMLWTSGPPSVNTTTLVVALVFTLLSTALSLPILNKLLQPLLDARAVLQATVEGNNSKPLPTHYQDEVGALLSQIQATLDDRNQAISDRDSLFDIIAHDFRTPINRIIGLCRIYDLCGEDERMHNIRTIQHEANELLRDMTHLLKCLKTSAAAGVNSVTNLTEATSAAVASLQAIATEKNVTIIQYAQTPVWVKADPFLIGQAIKNVIVNAIKYSDSGRSVYIQVVKEGSNVKLTVTDEGIGFDPADAEKIVARFTSKTRQGTDGEATNGLGLSIVKRIAERSGGSLSAHSKGPGTGATFNITLPLASMGETL
jgi:signal transduction histidine kinase